MTRPGSRSSARPPAAVPASIAGAVDLSGLKDRPAPPPTADNTDGGSGLAPIVDVTAATFEAEVLQRSMQVPVVVDLGSSRSPQSVALTRQLGQMAVEANGTWVHARVDVDSTPQVAQAFGVQAIPTVVAVAGGQPLADFQGSQPEEQLRRWLDAILQATEGKLSGPPGATSEEDEPEPEDPRFVAAEEALDEGDFDKAIAAYQAIVDAEPSNTDAKAALRQVKFLVRVQNLDADAVTKADADPSDVAAQIEAADVELSEQNAEAAFDRLIAGIKRTAGDERTQLRTRLLELFELFDSGDAVVVSARRKLAAALY
ncbi:MULTISPECIES: tetratricopeptide repeat protein [unclassified Rhodococcus (in: high G+C Gram-positive bacteria)]|uniref:tetratricopeptide repeat protein n=1 Tax=unclassified Rhodococcus (in: high G+C Gram-positive bacteria) TaxID=192944 RepID=UPI0027DF10B0|nr:MULTISPECIES: tetratricopeptide repeat protein [unclassified Rhodococcus (in: high G+C Gram-positive bacteria)]